MKTKKEHPAGDQVQDLNTFFGHERLSVEDHFKDIDNFLLFKDFPDNINQLQRVYSTLFARPMTMYEVALTTGIERANVCRYVAELRKSNNIAVVRLGICPITRHGRVQFLTTNPALFPQETQLGLSFDNVPTCTTSNKKGVSK